MNVNLLKSQIALRGKKILDIANILSISKTAIYRKLNGDSDFTRQEISKIIEYLGIDTDIAMKIFFEEKVS